MCCGHFKSNLMKIGQEIRILWLKMWWLESHTKNVWKKWKNVIFSNIPGYALQEIGFQKAVVTLDKKIWSDLSASPHK